MLGSTSSGFVLLEDSFGLGSRDSYSQDDCLLLSSYEPERIDNYNRECDKQGNTDSNETKATSNKYPPPSSSSSIVLLSNST